MASAPALPAPRGAGAYRVAVVCLGNICRSPIAAVVLEQRLAEAGLGVEVVSFGTAGWHVGNPMDPRSATTLEAAGYDASRHRARQITASDLAGLDLVLAMDAANLADLRALAEPGAVDADEPGDAARLLAYRALDPEADPLSPPDVPDPYHGGDEGFAATLATVERTTERLVAGLAEVAR